MEAEIASQAVGLGTNTDFTLMNLFLRADIVVKSVIIILIVCSIYSWAVIIDKFRLFKSKLIWFKSKSSCLFTKIPKIPGTNSLKGFLRGP